MEELKEKELPEAQEATEPTATEPETLHRVPQPAPPGFWQGVALGAVVTALVAVVAIFLILYLQPEPQIQTVTVQEKVYVQVEATEPTLPPPESNPLSPEDFTYVNGYLTCTAVPSVMGIDVSTFQKNIDWEQVKAAGVEFAMIRAAYRGYGNGAVLEDELVRTHYAGATAAGIKVGFYFFSQAINPQEAREEAEFLLNIIQDWQVDMPIVFDWEYISETARTAGISPRTLTDCAKAFCDRIVEAGLEPMVYFNSDQSRQDLYLSELTDYKFWLAMYNGHMTYEYRVDMWQYTQSGEIPGIDGAVDINLWFPEN